MFSAGMAESTMLIRWFQMLTMVENTRSSMQRTIELNYNLLRFQLGVAPDTKITLTETLKILHLKYNVEALFSQNLITVTEY